MDLGRDLAMLPELYRLFRREQPDIVHTHNPKPGWFGRIAARLAREVPDIPSGAVRIDNSGPLSDGIVRFVAALRSLAAG